MNKKNILLKTLPLFLLLIFSEKQLSAQFRVIGYLPNWGNLETNASNVDYTKITHLNIAFINPTNASGDLGPVTGLSNAVTYAHNGNVKILASMGGANGSSYYANLLTAANRPAFINKIVAFALFYNLDGIDIDLEGSAIDANYEGFVTDLRDTLVDHNLLLTAAIATWQSGSISNGALAQFDFVNIMSYDAKGTWAPNNPGQHSSYNFAVNDLYHWGTTRGVPANKMIVGVPFYGYEFNTNNGTAYYRSYKQILNTYPGNQNVDQYSPASGVTIYYNGIPTIKSKTALALDNAGGIMIWELTQDLPGPYSLLSAIDSIIQAASTNIKPTVDITSPADLSSFTEGDAITITANAADSDGSIYKVAFFAGTFKIGEDLSAPYSIDWTGAGADTYNIIAQAIDNMAGVTYDTISITINAGAQMPLGGVAWPVPGKIEAEDFDMGGNNVSYYDNAASNQGGAYRTGSVDIENCTDAGGGYNVGWTTNGEWLEYTVDVTATGLYDLKMRLATNLTSKRFNIKMDGVDITGDITVPATGGWQSWQTVIVPGISLTEGEQVMRITFPNGSLNFNYIEIVDAVTLGITGSFSTSNIVLEPNPFSNSATINFTLNNPGQTKIIIYDQIGRVVSTVADTYLNSGLNEIDLNGAALTKGMYTCHIIHNNEVKIIKVIKE